METVKAFSESGLKRVEPDAGCFRAHANGFARSLYSASLQSAESAVYVSFYMLSADYFRKWAPVATSRTGPKFCFEAQDEHTMSR